MSNKKKIYTNLFKNLKISGYVAGPCSMQVCRCDSSAQNTEASDLNEVIEWVNSALNEHSADTVLENLNQSIDSSPNEDNNYRFCRALFFLKTEQCSAALSDFQYLLKKNCNILSDIFYLPGFLDNQGQSNQALQLCNLLLKHYPNNIAILMIRGKLFYKQHDYQASLEDFYLILNIDPDNMTAHHWVNKLKEYCSEFRIL